MRKRSSNRGAAYISGGEDKGKSKAHFKKKKRTRVEYQAPVKVYYREPEGKK